MARNAKVFTREYTQADVTGLNLIIKHGLGVLYPAVSVWVDNPEEGVPGIHQDPVLRGTVYSIDPNTVEMRGVTIDGTWRVRVIG